jgi:hypothetical protein
MRRAFGWLLLFGLVAVGLSWPLLGSSASGAAAGTDPVVISKYRGDFTVAGDGTLNAVETRQYYNDAVATLYYQMPK